MAKPRSLRNALTAQRPTGATAVAERPAAQGIEPRTSKQPSREGRANVTGYYPPAVKRELRHLAADLDTTIEDLLAEAINELFAKHGRPEIAPRRSRRND